MYIDHISSSVRDHHRPHSIPILTVGILMQFYISMMKSRGFSKKFTKYSKRENIAVEFILRASSRQSIPITNSQSSICVGEGLFLIYLYLRPVNCEL